MNPGMRSKHHGDHTYVRVWPAAKALMRKYNIKEEELPNFKVIMKEHVLDLIERKFGLKGSSHSHSTEDLHHFKSINENKEKKIVKSQATQPSQVSPPSQSPQTAAPHTKKQEIKLNNIIEETEVNKNTEINYADLKMRLPHIYFHNSAKIDNLIRHIKEINNNHKKNLGIEDFIAKVIF